MKIAIIGTRGIPNRYGGFEQFAEIVSQYWVNKGHEVICYNPESHFYELPDYKGVTIVKVYSPEAKIGSAANFIYDYLCLKDAIKRKCDILLELGYQSSAWSFLTISKNDRKKLVTNMDGLEWKRDKWSPAVKSLTKWMEKLAVKLSGTLISDNQGIADYYKRNFGVDSFCIAYGCEAVGVTSRQSFQEYVKLEGDYDLLIARLEPENSVEKVIKGVFQSNCTRPLIVVGNHETKYGEHLKAKYKCEKVKFIGGIFDKEALDALRQHATLYYHGHTVGGTNPSLLEAMAAGSNIVAHSNEFNMAVLENNALYFNTSSDIENIRNSTEADSHKFNEYRILNKRKIKEVYSWELISEAYLTVFDKVLSKCE